MRAASLFAGCLIAAAAAGTAAAQPAPTQPEPELVQPVPPPAAAYEGRNDAGWRLYHEAFGALLQGKRQRAVQLAARLRREHAGHPAAALVAASPLALAETGERKAGREEPSSAARAELALFQTLHGIALGSELCVALQCEEGGPYFGLGLLGGALGAFISLKGIPHVTSGQRALLNSGTAWGTFNALLALLAAEPDEARTYALGLIAGQGAGLVAGAALFQTRPTAGQVGLANTGGQWGAVLTWLTLRAASTEPSRKEILVSMILGADAGLGVGAYLAKIRPGISRAQTLVIDAGGVVGAVGGGGIGVLIAGSYGDATTSGLAAVGAALGLGAAAYFTRNWGDSDDDGGGGGRGGGGGAHAVVMPAEHGRGGLVGLAGTW